VPENIIACIGNPLVGDDAFGFRVYQQLQKSNLNEQARLLFFGCQGLEILDELQGESYLIIVDAFRSEKPAGTIINKEYHELTVPPGSPVTSHDIGIREALEIGKLLKPDCMPKQVFLVGVVGHCFQECGAPLTPAVEKAVGQVVEHILHLITEQN